MEEENIETPIQSTKFVKSEPAVTQVPETGKGFSFDKLWFIPVILALGAVIVVGALWVTNKGLLAPKPSPTPVAGVDEDTAALEEQGGSDEISTIEADLNATNLSNIDKELTDIDSELSSP